MKELNEYKQEIFRRSEEKKRQIRKHRRIALGVGIPLCLCAVMTAAVLPLIPSGMKWAMAPSTEAVCDEEVIKDNGMMEMPVKAFHVTDPVTATRIWAILEEAEQNSVLNKDEIQKDPLSDQAEPEDYRLILQCPDGSTVCYQVRGQAAYCETTGETQWLSDTQVSSLYTLLTEVADHE